MFKNQRIMKCFRLIEKHKIKENFLGFVKIGEVGKLFFPILFTFLSFSIATSQVVVTLGDNIAICEDDIVQLADLDPFVSGANGDIWWEAGDDNHNSAGFNDTTAYPDAVSYTPDATDKAAGFVVIKLKAREHNPNGDVSEASVKVFLRGDVLFACNDKVNVPLNFHCEYQLTPPMLLEGEDSDIPYTLYDIDVYDENGLLIPNDLLTGDYIGQTLTFNVTHQCSWNSCGGKIVVKDNYHPITSCGNDTITCQFPTTPEYIGFPIDTHIIQVDTIKKVGDFKYIVEGWDACGDVELTYRDDSLLFDCAADTSLQEIIIRNWKAVDESGNISRCVDSIFVERVPIDSVKLPPSWNNMDTVALQCDGDWLLTALPDGHPSPEYTGEPEIWYCSAIEFNFEDSEFPGCGNTFDVIRKWTIIDWCRPDKIIHYTQIIKVMDTLAPIMTCTNELVTIGADPYECNSIKYELDVPDVSDNCSTFSLFVRVYDYSTGLEVAVYKENGKYFVQHLPLGDYYVEFTAIDDCDNISNCQYDLEVIDDMRPYMICDQHTKVNLGTNGEARLYSDKVDDGSFDNCEIVKMDIRKMTYECDSAYFEFGDFIGFCCAESGQTIMVEMRATDASGNTNSCMVEVIVEDKLPPQITCPPDIEISCDFYYNPEDLSRYFGKVVTNEEDREDIIINDGIYSNGVIGRDGLAYDNCNVIVKVDSFFDVNNCGIGEIHRTFTAQDNGGRTNPCVQTIYIFNDDPFNKGDITWPENKSFIGCSSIEADTAITGSPIVNDDGCSMIAMNYEDQLFAVQGDACKKIVRKWTVRDWCQPDYVKWEHEQIIMLTDTINPVFSSDCSDREVPVYGECRGLVELSAAASDNCTPVEDLLWRWKLDSDNDGVYDEFGQDNHFSKTMDEGSYEIAWVVEDRCGNESICEYKFTVKDRKNPTPYCITDLTTVVMNFGGMVTIDADKFDHGSSDNCTPSEDLIFSFSKDTSYNEYNITCDSLIDGVARTFYLKMWVTDKANNQDYCNVLLRVTDNNGVCEDAAGLAVSGKMLKWKDDSNVKGVKLELKNNSGEYVGNMITNTSGKYTFNNVSIEGFEIDPADNVSNCMEGVSTFDIVTIQKHLLGIKKMKSPYQFIAADANRSKSISAADILMIRKLILGTVTKFPENDCWVYPDAKQQLTTSNAFTYRSKLVYNNLTSSIIDADFKVVKIGDVNGSFNTAGLVPRSEVNIELDNVMMQEGMEYEIPVYLSTEIEGMQFTIDYNLANVEFVGFVSQQYKLDNSNFGYHSLDKGIVTFSWNSLTNNSIDTESPVFFLKFKANKEVSVANSISINSKITKALLIKDGEEVEFKLNYRNDNLLDELAVYQNSPNPFNDETTIRFSIPNSDVVSLDIYSMEGKLVYNTAREFDKGLNTIKISSSQLQGAGVFYYTVKVAGNSITKKMIVIK